jgi:hypothetical protein
MIRFMFILLFGMSLNCSAQQKEALENKAFSSGFIGAFIRSMGAGACGLALADYIDAPLYPATLIGAAIAAVDSVLAGSELMDRGHKLSKRDPLYAQKRYDADYGCGKLLGAASVLLLSYMFWPEAERVA